MAIKTVYLIRHAEKPDDGMDLSPKGYVRSGALGAAFDDAVNDGAYLAIGALYATAPTKSSRRPLETLQPLASRLQHVDLNAQYQLGDEADLASAIGALKAETALVAWHHEGMPNLAVALGVRPKPEKPGESVFDRLWTINLTTDPPTLTDAPQRLLEGDSTV